MELENEEGADEIVRETKVVLVCHDFVRAGVWESKRCCKTCHRKGEPQDDTLLPIEDFCELYNWPQLRFKNGIVKIEAFICCSAAAQFNWKVTKDVIVQVVQDKRKRQRDLAIEIAEMRAKQQGGHDEVAVSRPSGTDEIETRASDFRNNEGIDGAVPTGRDPSDQR